MEFILDFILHIDQYMISIVQDYHTWAYAILFIIIFCETGLVLTPFPYSCFNLICSSRIR